MCMKVAIVASSWVLGHQWRLNMVGKVLSTHTLEIRLDRRVKPARKRATCGNTCKCVEVRRRASSDEDPIGG